MELWTVDDSWGFWTRGVLFEWSLMVHRGRCRGRGRTRKSKHNYGILAALRSLTPFWIIHVHVWSFILESGCKWCWRFSQNNTGCTVSLYLSVIHLCEEWTRKRHDWKNWKHYHLGYLGCCNVAKCCRYTTVKALDGTSAGNQGSWDDMSLCQSAST